MTKKELKDMTLEELWQLFPIFLVPPKKEWAEQYAEMEKRLSDVLSGCPVFRIGHIGSTAVPGIWAKDIVDVLVEIDPTATLEEAAKCLDKEGFTRMFTEDKRISLNFGYTKKGFSDEVYHIHLRYTGDNDELYFRDYLIAHPDIAKEYETLKKRLWKEYEHDRDAYTESKTAFIQGYTSVAKKEYAGRYENHAILTERLFLRPWYLKQIVNWIFETSYCNYETAGGLWTAILHFTRAISLFLCGRSGISICVRGNGPGSNRPISGRSSGVLRGAGNSEMPKAGILLFYLAGYGITRRDRCIITGRGMSVFITGG